MTTNSRTTYTCHLSVVAVIKTSLRRVSSGSHVVAWKLPWIIRKVDTQTGQANSAQQCAICSGQRQFVSRASSQVHLETNPVEIPPVNSCVLARQLLPQDLDASNLILNLEDVVGSDQSAQKPAHNVGNQYGAEYSVEVLHILRRFLRYKSCPSHLSPPP